MKFWIDARTVLFVIPGALLQVAHLALFRETIAVYGNPLLVAAILMITVFSLMAVGIALPVDGISRRYGAAMTLWLLSLALSTSAILVMVAVPLSASKTSEASLVHLALVACAGALPLALASGMLLKFIYRLTPDPVPKNALGFFGFGYLFAGVSLDSTMLLESMQPLILAIGTVFVFCSASALRYRRKNIKTAAVAGISGCVLVGNIFLLEKAETAREWFWQQRNPGLTSLHEFNSPAGRTTLLKDVDTGSLLLFKNGTPVFVVPDDCSRHTQGILPAILQPGKRPLKVLALCSPFSLIPRVLTSLAPVEEVVFPVYHRKMAAISDMYRILPGEAANLRPVFAEPFFFLKTTREKFDLVVLLENDDAYCGFETLVALSEKRLAPDGVLVIASGLLASGSAAGQLDELFDKSVLLPGGGELHAFGGSSVSADPVELEKRFAQAFADIQDNPLPRGVFSVLYSIPPSVLPRALPKIEKFDVPKINVPRENMKIGIRLPLVAAAFIVLRFLFCRRGNYGTLLGLFENSVCTTAIMLLLATIVYDQGLSLFVEDKTMIAAFGCGGIGFALSGLPVLKRLSPFLALLTVAFVFSCQWNDFFYVIPAIIGMDCLSSGLVAGYFADIQPQRTRRFFPAVLLVGCAVGALLFLLLPDLPENFYIALAAVTLLRIPLFFSRLIVGRAPIQKSAKHCQRR